MILVIIPLIYGTHQWQIVTDIIAGVFGTNSGISTHRLMPIIGQYQISDIARVSYILHERWGRIVRLGGLLGRPDLLFVYDADEIEKVCRF